MKDYAKSLLEQAERFEKISQSLFDYFSEKQDKSFEIKLAGQNPEKIRNLKIKEDMLTFKSETSATQSEKQAKFSQIGPGFIIEKVVLLPPDEKGNEFFKGLVYVKWGDYAKAVKNFNAMEHGCGVPLSKLAPERRAEKEFSKILLNCGITSATDASNNLKLIADISKLEMKQEQAEEIFSMIQAYKAENSGLETYDKAKNVLEALENQCRHADKKNRLVKQIVLQKGDKACLGDALADEIQNISGRAVLKLPKGKYKAEKMENIISLIHKELSIVGERDVEIESPVEIAGQNIEISGMVFNGRFTIRKTSKNIKIKNCFFSQADAMIDHAEDIAFENCFIRQITVRNAKNVSFAHCTLTTFKMAKAVVPLDIEGDSVEINDSIVYGDRYAVVFSGKGSSSKRKFSNSIVFGEDGIAIEKDQNDKLDEKSAIKKQSGLSKVCKVKNGIFAAPQFIDAQNGDWALVPETQGSKAAKDGSDIGVLWSVFRENAQLPQPGAKN